MAEMNVSGFSGGDDDNVTNRSFVPSDDRYTDSTISQLYVIMWYVVLALGLPGNVWDPMVLSPSLATCCRPLSG